MHDAFGRAQMASLTACNKYVIKSGNGGDVSSAPKKAEWTMHFVDGLIGEGSVDVQSVCGGNDATIKIERNFVDGLIAGITGLLVMPSHVDVYCGAAAPVAQLPLTQKNAQTIARSDDFRASVAAIAPERLGDVDQIRAAAF